MTSWLHIRCARALLGVAAAAWASGCGPGEWDLDGGDQVTVGQLYVAQRGCANCHQGPLPSDGVLAGQTTPVKDTTAYGNNLTPDPGTGIGDWADIEILRAIRYGVDNHQQRLCPSMPKYDGSDGGQPLMTDLEAAAVIAYLRSLPPVSRATPASLCPPFKSPAQDLIFISPDLRRPPPDATAGADMASATDDAGVPDDAAVPDDAGMTDDAAVVGD